MMNDTPESAAALVDGENNPVTLDHCYRIKQRIVVHVNGRDLPAVEWDTPLEKKVRIRIPAGISERRKVT